MVIELGISKKTKRKEIDSLMNRSPFGENI